MVLLAVGFVLLIVVGCITYALLNAGGFSSRTGKSLDRSKLAIVLSHSTGTCVQYEGLGTQCFDGEQIGPLADIPSGDCAEVVLDSARKSVEEAVPAECTPELLGQ